jgi:bisphosphoglycerate-independent phosphoglycerate mutase (AlkP superfamily)
MALTTPEVIRTAEDLYNNEAVMQDITRETIQDRYADIPVISPQSAAEHLCRLAQANDFTFFEFFQTDVSGHSMDYERACAVLRIYDRFLATVCRLAETSGITIVITSDHGNIENMSERGHTFNKVPFISIGPGAASLREGVESLVDVAGSFLRAMGG